MATNAYWKVIEMVRASVNARFSTTEEWKFHTRAEAEAFLIEKGESVSDGNTTYLLAEVDRPAGLAGLLAGKPVR